MALYTWADIVAVDNSQPTAACLQPLSSLERVSTSAPAHHRDRPMANTCVAARASGHDKASPSYLSLSNKPLLPFLPRSLSGRCAEPVVTASVNVAVATGRPSPPHHVLEPHHGVLSIPIEEAE